ncbi:flagellar hook-associated protein FlgL [Aeribacillus sp. FSL K6-8210]|uniref:flagellar hook-associated protein FlgL n=1 Tax=Aeribacillus sp. FSL K6-8210 TaxID=2954683 RepID=UPI0030D2EEA6
MRVTQSMLAQNSLRHLSKSYELLGKYQDQMLTRKKITRPSQDPVVAMKGLYYRTNLKEVEQYKRNLSEAYLWIENSEAGLEQANQGLQRIRELLIRAKNGTNSEDERDAVAREVKQIKDDLVAVANTQVAGRYIFNGTKTDSAPVSGDPPVVNNNNEPFKIELSKNIQIQVNITPDNVFNQAMFNTIQDIQNALENNDTTNLDSLLGQLDDHIDALNAERAELGARYNRIEQMENRIGQQEVISTKILSDNEDADIERVIIDLKEQESAHRAALAVSARIIQPNLVDFLR